MKFDIGSILSDNQGSRNVVIRANENAKVLIGVQWAQLGQNIRTDGIDMPTSRSENIVSKGKMEDEDQNIAKIK